jgi:hypothetical protein
MRISPALLFLLAPLAMAHVVSMSTGEIKVDGPTAVYELRMPMYEVAHVRNPESTLLQHIRFDNGHQTRSQCHQEGDTYVCIANYEFPALLPDKLDIECDFFQVTVPNHIHLLTATQGANSDQAVFDKSTTAFEIRFHPPSAQEVLLRNLTGGAWRALTSLSGWLLLAGLAVAARSWKDAGAMAAVFLTLEWLAPLAAPFIPVTLSAKFLELALALAVAYLAVELLFIPEGSGRWVAILAGGIVGGLTFAGLPRTYLAGANVVQIAGIAGFCFGLLRLRSSAKRWAAGALLALATGWFALGLVHP